MNFIIIANGNLKDYNFARKIINKHNFIICADGGAKHLYNMGICPDVLVGDFDSINADIEKHYVDKNVKFIRFPIHKNYTDTELAVEYAIENGAKKITLMAVMGSRMDHTLSNITLLVYIVEKGIEAEIIDEHNIIMATKHSLEINGVPGELLSIIPLSEKVENMSIEGLEYPLKNATIHIGSSLGVSNKFIESKVKITFDLGTILLIKSKD